MRDFVVHPVFVVNLIHSVEIKESMSSEKDCEDNKEVMNMLSDQEREEVKVAL